MAAFELQDGDFGIDATRSGGPDLHDHKRVKEERIIAQKVYDSCRRQNCLTPQEIGPARSAEEVMVGETQHYEGDIIRPPHNTASATVDQLTVAKILILDKQPSPFKNGYWDVDVKFVFEYRITFREADAGKIGEVMANNIYTMKVCLFGSVAGDLVVGTDLTGIFGEQKTFGAEPFILVEAKALSLNSSLHYPTQRPRRGDNNNDDGEHATEVWVTIGLFSIIYLFRLVTLSVESKGFDIPGECGPLPGPVNPCAFFEDMDFPMDIFAPPQKPEFSAGISINIPSKR